MGLHFDRPWLLLLLIPVSLWLYWAWKRTYRLTGGRKITAFALRAVIMLLLLSVASGMTLALRADYRAVMFVADRSSSVADDARIAAWISEAVSGKDDPDRAGIVSVGRTAAMERPLTAEAGSSALRARLDPTFTNLADGLRLAGSQLPEGGRIILLSDGRNNAGGVIRQSRLLKSQGIAVDVVPLPSAGADDAAIESLNVPAAVKIGERFTIELDIVSTVGGGAELRLFENEREIARETVQLTPGSNRFMLQNVAGAAGFNRYRAEIYMPGDERPHNDAAYGFSVAEGPPRVLVVEGDPGSSANITSALEASLIPYDLTMPEMLSVELADYARYDAIVLNNVPATRLSQTVMDRLAAAVGDLGIGLVAAGGRDSYGLGGYYDTPLERALPVYMDLKGRRQMPSLGLILVIDRSGSMHGGKIELAKEAALRTIGLLRGSDTVGVVAFDDSPWWVVEPTQLTDRDAVMEAVQGIQPAGGTDIYPAVETALERMRGTDAQRRHIILLTDGMSAGSGNYNLLTDTMNEEGITMSTVAVGSDADTVLLKRLADAAQGRYYFTNDQSTIPAIFSRETAMMARTYIVENRFIPAVGHAGGWTPLFAEGVPAVDAYVATTPKETAETVLLSPEGDPLLARWSFGSGRTVAWTSDLAGEWSADWALWPQFPDVLAAWVKWTFPQFSTDPYHVQATVEGGAAELKITAQGGRTDQLTVTVAGEDGRTRTLQAVPEAPGEYTVRMEDAEPGAYLMQISASEAAGDSPSGGALAGFVIPYSPEFRLAGGDEGHGTLAEIAALTGGRVLSLDEPGEAFRIERVPARDRIDLVRPLLIAALLLWLADIAVRRLSLPWGGMAAALIGRLAAARRRGAETTGGAGALPRLRERTRSAGDFYAGSRSNSQRPAVHQADTAQAGVRSEPDRGTAAAAGPERPGRSASGGAPTGKAARGIEAADAANGRSARIGSAASGGPGAGGSGSAGTASGHAASGSARADGAPSAGTASGHTAAGGSRTDGSTSGQAGSAMERLLAAKRRGSRR